MPNGTLALLADLTFVSTAALPSTFASLLTLCPAPRTSAPGHPPQDRARTLFDGRLTPDVRPLFAVSFDDAS
jgi:hypothetical protein